MAIEVAREGSDERARATTSKGAATERSAPAGTPAARGTADPTQYPWLRQERAPAEALNIESAIESRPAPADRRRRLRRLQPQVAEHAVFLVPGLLGFENFATFTYFADRVAAALRAGLERACD